MLIPKSMLYHEPDRTLASPQRVGRNWPALGRMEGSVDGEAAIATGNQEYCITPMEPAQS